MNTRLRSWPEDGAALRRKATLMDLTNGAGASIDIRPSPLWQELLNREAGDLTLRRTLALLADKPEPLEELVPSVEESLRAERWISHERAPSATLLDSGAAWLHRDGTVTERVRTLEVPLDENALGPARASSSSRPERPFRPRCRTHKSDGQILDADAQVSGEKRTISAGLAPGGRDLLEIEDVMATPPPRRGRGAAAEAFYFTAGDSSLQRSIYAIGAEAGPDTSRSICIGSKAPRSVTRHRPHRAAAHVDALPDEPAPAAAERVLPLGPGGLGELQLE